MSEEGGDGNKLSDIYLISIDLCQVCRRLSIRKSSFSYACNHCQTMEEECVANMSVTVKAKFVGS